jgi:hypothetical protein
MATFFTRIILDDIVKTEERFFEGGFVIDVMELNIWQKFDFVVAYHNSVYESVFIYKNGKVFLQKIHSSRVKKKNHSTEQAIILRALEIIFSAFRGKLRPERFALTTVEHGQKISVSAATPDIMRVPMMRACCL